MFRDHKGKRSLTRILTAAAVAALIFWPLVLWTAVSLGSKPVALVALPDSVVEFVKWALGFILAWAGHNKYQETRLPGTPPPPKAP